MPVSFGIYSSLYIFPSIVYLRLTHTGTGSLAWLYDIASQRYTYSSVQSDELILTSLYDTSSPKKLHIPVLLQSPVILIQSPVNHVPASHSARDIAVRARVNYAGSQITGPRQMTGNLPNHMGYCIAWSIDAHRRMQQCSGTLGCLRVRRVGTSSGTRCIVPSSNDRQEALSTEPNLNLAISLVAASQYLHGTASPMLRRFVANTLWRDSRPLTLSSIFYSRV